MGRHLTIPSGRPNIDAQILYSPHRGAAHLMALCFRHSPISDEPMPGGLRKRKGITENPVNPRLQMEQTGWRVSSGLFIVRPGTARNVRRRDVLQPPIHRWRMRHISWRIDLEFIARPPYGRTVTVGLLKKISGVKLGKRGKAV